MNAVPAPGHVVEKFERSHGRVRYEYNVDGKTYIGEDSAGDGGTPSFSDLRAGDEVRVYHLVSAERALQALARRFRAI